MKLTVTPLERPSRAKRQGLHYHMPMGGCFIQTRPNTGEVFGRTNNILVEHCPMSYRYFPHCCKDRILGITSVQYHKQLPQCV